MSTRVYIEWLLVDRLPHAELATVSVVDSILNDGLLHHAPSRLQQLTPILDSIREESAKLQNLLNERSYLLSESNSSDLYRIEEKQWIENGRRWRQLGVAT
ncbi:MAG: hypothetical protein HC836_10580 [Richelia sp. RM2_1_2]|nr:hypothetical protein [Richelia sp. RM2_1_2]